jgi:hypothetical protein
MAVAERADLVGLGDDELLRRMAREQRAIMTNNVKDSCRSLAAPPSRPTTTRACCSPPRHQGDDAHRNQVQWLAAGGARPPAPVRRAGAGE